MMVGEMIRFGKKQLVSASQPPTPSTHRIEDIGEKSKAFGDY